MLSLPNMSFYQKKYIYTYIKLKIHMSTFYSKIIYIFRHVEGCMWIEYNYVEEISIFKCIIYCSRTF